MIFDQISCFVIFIKLSFDILALINHGIELDTLGTKASKNLNERKLVRGKERRKEGNFISFLISFSLLFFGSGTQGKDWSALRVGLQFPAPAEGLAPSSNSRAATSLYFSFTFYVAFLVCFLHLLLCFILVFLFENCKYVL